MKRSIVENIKQVLLIVFSVVLGIFLSERIEEQKTEKEATLLLSRIKSEVADNKMLMEKWAPYHQDIVNRLDTLIPNDSFILDFAEDPSTLFKRVLKKGTLMGRMPSSDAWEIAKAHPLTVHFDYDELPILSKIYNQQKMTFEPANKIAEFFYSTDLNEIGKARKNLKEFRNQMGEIVGREKQLMEYFREGEQILKY